MLVGDERPKRLRHFRECIESKLMPYGPGIDFAVKERFVDYGTDSILVILKKGSTDVTRTTKYEEIEDMEETAWLQEMVNAFPKYSAAFMLL